MRRIASLCLLTCLLPLAGAETIEEEKPTHIHSMVQLLDGTRIQGVLVAEDDEALVLLVDSRDGTATEVLREERIPRSHIAAVASQTIDGEAPEAGSAPVAAETDDAEDADTASTALGDRERIEKEIGRREDKLARQQERLGERQAEVTTLEREISAITTRVAAIDQELGPLERESRRLGEEARRDARDGYRTRGQGDLNRVNNRITALRKERKELIAPQARLEAILQGKRISLGRIQDNIAGYEKSLASYREALAGLDAAAP